MTSGSRDSERQERTTRITQNPPHGHGEDGICWGCVRLGEQRQGEFLLRVAEAAKRRSERAR